MEETVMEEEKTSTVEQKTKSKTGIVVAVSAVIIIVLIGVIAFIVLKKPPEEPQELIQETADGRGTLITPENVDEILAGDKTPEGFFETCMTNDWTFNDGVSSVDDVYVKNADSNVYTIYFDLKLNNDRVIYSSPYIPVGAELPQFTLTDIPEKGDYEAVVLYNLVDENNEKISDVPIAVTLHIN
jgi:hypothetical protein